MGFLTQTLQAISFTAKRVKECGPTQEACNQFLSGLESIAAMANMIGQQSVVDNLITLATADESDGLWSTWKMLDGTDPRNMSGLSIFYLGLLTEVGFPTQKAKGPIEARLSNDNGIPAIFYACINGLWLLGDTHASEKMKEIMKRQSYSDPKQFKNDQIVQFVLTISQS